MCQNSELYAIYLLQLMFILVQQYLILFTLERMNGQTVLFSLVLSLYIYNSSVSELHKQINVVWKEREIVY